MVRGDYGIWIATNVYRLIQVIKPELYPLYLVVMVIYLPPPVMTMKLNCGIIKPIKKFIRCRMLIIGVGKLL